MAKHHCILSLALVLGCARAEDAARPAGTEGAAFFESRIRPVLIEHCYKCHSAESDKLKGGLRVDFRDGLLKGGNTGPAIVPGQNEKSLLIQAIRRVNEELSMPPKNNKKLSTQQIADFEKWVSMGAPDPRDKASPSESLSSTSTVDFEKARRFWSFQPPVVVGLASVPAGRDAGPTQNPIDGFIADSLKGNDLAPAADKRTLIRRATFDLTGLPPTPEEVAAFLADAAPLEKSFGKVVERLLASPAYGERWGRHWLDVARYADTAGDNSDFPVPQLFRYRNYVIQSFNQDVPYDQFVREQIAGDLLVAPTGATGRTGVPARLENPPTGTEARPTTGTEAERRERIVATGFLALSRRFGSSREEAPNHLTIEDTLDTIGRSMLGLTFSCTRCHDHKFDPLTMADYYGLYGIFESTRYPFPGAELNNRPMDLVPLPDAVADKLRRESEATLAPLEAELKRLTAAAGALDTELKAWAGKKKVLASGDIANGARQDFPVGAKVAPASVPAGRDAGPTLQIQAGEMLELLVLPKQSHGNDTTLVELVITELEGQKRNWNVARDALAHLDDAGKGDADVPWYFYDALKACTLLATFTADAPNAAKAKGIHTWKNAEDTPVVTVNANEKPVVLTTATLPAHAFAVHPSPKGAVGVAWQSPFSGAIRITGSIADADPQGGDGVAWTLQVRPSIGDKAARLRDLNRELAQVKAKRDALAAKTPPAEKAYAVAEGKAANAKIQKRGDPTTPGPEVPRGFPKILGGQTLPSDEKGSGRLQLAQWLSDPANPLTARVMANRIWQHHFGRGLVATPNDFGTRGAAPSHPELLDYLAVRFVKEGWSIKQMHRLIMSSRTYQLSSRPTFAVVSSPPGGEGRVRGRQHADPASEPYSKFERRRLDAESIRDAMLFVSGALEPAPQGPHPFPKESTWTFTQHVPFSAVYENRQRSVYLMQQRIKKHPFLALFDGADPNASTGLRMDSTTPIQALFAMNDPFVHDCAARFAARLLQARPTDGARIELAHQLAFGRPATSEEAAACAEYLSKFSEKLRAGREGRAGVPAGQEVEQKAWQSLARALLCSNEFIFVD